MNELDVMISGLVIPGASTAKCDLSFVFHLIRADFLLRKKVGYHRQVCEVLGFLTFFRDWMNEEI